MPKNLKSSFLLGAFIFTGNIVSFVCLSIFKVCYFILFLSSLLLYFGELLDHEVVVDIVNIDVRHGNCNTQHVYSHNVESPLPSLFRIENNSRDNVPKDNTQRCTEDEKGHVEADIFFITDRVNPYWEVDQIEDLTEATH